jgi:hypothetical protein
MNTRRQFITLVGGGVVFAASSNVTAGVYPDRAVEAWQPIAPTAQIRQWMLAHALLAPNPHNRQPWIADLSRENEITLLCDGERLLPETDPFGRQILIGCGAFLELAILAAAQRGYAVELALFPEGEPVSTALPKGAVFAQLKVTKNSAVKPDPLFAFIRSRHTNKGAYDANKKLPPDQKKGLELIAQSVSPQGSSMSAVVEEPAKMQAVRDITRIAYEIELTTPRTYLESAKLFRIGPTAIEKHRDGISITGMMPRIMSTLGLFNPMEVPVKGSSGYKQVMDRWQPFESASGYLWMATLGNSRSQQVQVGRAYVRTHLLAASFKIDLHPLSQAIQEFAEVKVQNQALYKLLELDPAKATLQMLVRVGYGLQPATGTPRRALDKEMIRKSAN